MNDIYQPRYCRSIILAIGSFLILIPQISIAESVPSLDQIVAEVAAHPRPLIPEIATISAGPTIGPYTPWVVSASPPRPTDDAKSDLEVAVDAALDIGKGVGWDTFKEGVSGALGEDFFGKALSSEFTLGVKGLLGEAGLVDFGSTALGLLGVSFPAADVFLATFAPSSTAGPDLDELPRLQPRPFGSPLDMDNTSGLRNLPSTFPPEQIGDPGHFSNTPPDTPPDFRPSAFPTRPRP